MSGDQSAILGAGFGLRPTGLISGGSVFAALQTYTTGAISSTNGLKTVVTGSLTANALSTILSLSGRGVLSCLCAANNNNGSRTHRLKVTIDGVVVIDMTSGASATNTAEIFFAIGNGVPTAATPSLILDPIAFNSSLLVEYASSLTETGSSKIGYRYMPL